jgi:hypothetical protein
MGKFVRNITVRQQWDNDAWTFVLRPLSHARAVELSQLAQSGASEGAVQLHLTRLLPEFTVEVSGGRDASGEALGAAEVYESAYFAELVALVSARWVEASMPGNSGPSAA